VHPADLSRVVGPNRKKTSTLKGTRPVNSVTIDSNKHEIRGIQLNMTETTPTKNITYVALHAHLKKGNSWLVDGGAASNGGVAGEDVRVILHTNRKVNITGIANHQLPDLSICTIGGVVRYQW